MLVGRNIAKRLEKIAGALAQGYPRARGGSIKENLMRCCCFYPKWRIKENPSPVHAKKRGKLLRREPPTLKTWQVREPTLEENAVDHIT
ncbi:MAG: hypothetical protein DA408_21185 [Bacteroidetes bacterium]|nr:MAG: hypothetical protein C7N36_12970 [Bacteroidota bacterium]PTM08071.1 MAG: hypothetical protein DA408_21185 [Bacteroidota bacterium]